MNVITVRASSWGSLFDCAYRWEGEHLLGIRKPAGLRAQLGTAVHASTAVFDASRLPGASPVSATDASDVFYETLHRPEREVDYKQDNITVREAELIGSKLHSRYCAEVAPGFTYAAVESKLDPLEIDAGVGQVVRLTGTMDRARVAVGGGSRVIFDLKTGSRVIENDEVGIKGRAPQLGVYQLMDEQTNGQPTTGAGVIGLLTTTAAKVGVSRVFDAKRVMLGTEQWPGLIEHAASMFRTGLFPPNPQSTLCSQKFCARWARCGYREP